MKRILPFILSLFVALAACAGAKAPANSLGPPPIAMPTITNQISWLGGGGPWYNMPTWAVTPLTALGVGWARGDFSYGKTDTYTFAWSACQPASSNMFDWSRADAEVNFLSQFPWKIVVQLDEGTAVIPEWAWRLGTNEYAAAKANFINALAQRYAGRIWGIEIQNEPHSYQVNYGLVQYSIPLSGIGYDLHLAILRASQPARAYCKLIAWNCQAAFPDSFTYLMDRGLTNLCDAISFHMYSHRFQPPDVTLKENPSDPTDGSYPGRLDLFMAWLRSQIGNMPILVDEVGLEPVVPMRMAKVLIMLRSQNVDCLQLHVWGFGPPPGELVAFGGTPPNPYPHAAISAWTAYWLGNNSLVSQTVDNNTLIFSFGNCTFAWCLEGTLRPCIASGWDSITDILGNRISPTFLNDAVTVFHGAGTLTLTNGSPWRVLQTQ